MNNLLSPKTQKLQEELGKYCQALDSTATIESNSYRFKQYPRLIHNIFIDFLEQGFPITRAVLESSEWNLIVEDFISNHSCQEAEAWKIPLELVRYIQHSKRWLDAYPFLFELLHFEWLEIEIFNQENEPLNNNVQIGVNPYHSLDLFKFNVHQKVLNKAFTKGDYFILTYRDLDNHQVHFIELNALSALFFESLTELNNEHKAISTVCEELKIDRTVEIESALHSLISTWEEKKIVWRNF